MSSKMIVLFAGLTFAFPSGHLGPCNLSIGFHTSRTVTANSVEELTSSTWA